MINGLDTTGFWAVGTSTHSCSKPPTAQWWCNPEYDKYMATALLEPDRVKRAELMRAATRVFREDVAHLPLIVTPTFLVRSSKIKGFQWEGSMSFSLDSAYRVE